MRFSKAISFLFSYFIFIQLSLAQLNGKLIDLSLKFNTPFTVTQYSTKEGLPQSQVLKVIQKKSGALILYTANGIVEFDGYNFKSPITDTSYKKQFFRSLIYNELNDVLIGFDEYQTLYNLTPDFKRIKLSKNNAVGIAKNNDSTILVFYQTGQISSYNLKSGKEAMLDHLKIEYGVNEQFVLACVKNNYIYISTNLALYSLDINTGSCQKLKMGSFNVIEENKYNNKVYAFESNKFLRLDSGKIEEEILNTRMKNISSVRDVDFANTNDVYMATGSGVYAYEYGGFDRYSYQDGLSSEEIFSLHIDSLNECMFVGTGEKGLLKLQLKSNYSYTKNEGLGSTSVNSIVRTNEGKVLVAYNCCDIYELHSDTAYRYISMHKNYSSLAFFEDKLFAGTWGDGVKIFDGNKLIDSIAYPTQLRSGQVQACFQDSKKNIWVGTGKGLSCGANIKEVKPVFAEIAETVINLYELRDGSLCVGVIGGAYIIKGGKIVAKLFQPEGFYGKEVRAFYEDAEGKIWMGSYNGGLYCYHKSKLTSINKMKNCFLDADAFTLAKDGSGNIYMTSNHGLWHVSESNLNDFYNGKLDYLIPFHDTEESGILNTEFNGGFQNNYLENPNSHFYFPSLEGVVMVLQDEVPYKKLMPSINKAEVNGVLNEKNSHVFDKGTHSIKFEFSCVNFSNKNNVYFQYRLKGEKNTEWSVPQKNAMVDLELLPSGKYSFQVRALDGFNDKTPNVAQYDFEITPWVYETLWFRIISIVLFACIILLVFRLRNKSLSKKLKEKQRIEKRMAELELNILQAQMNPHFIYNSLNSLKYFLSVGDLKRADIFVDDFSFLLRKVMVYSNERLISVSEEVAMLQAYIELERIRMNNLFTYSIEVSDGLNEKLIPTFIIQPFVENAIKHGFPQKKGSCHLSITITHSNNIICCIIEDNGIGREKAGKLKNALSGHESKGIENVLERIAIKKDSYGKNISIEIVDKVDHQQNSKGTMVIINIEEINDTYYNN